MPNLVIDADRCRPLISETPGVVVTGLASLYLVRREARIDEESLAKRCGRIVRLNDGRIVANARAA